MSSRITGSAMNPALITSARPLTYSARGSDSSTVRSARTPAGGGNTPTRVFPSGMSTAGYPPDGGVGHPQQRGGSQHNPHPAQPGGRHEAGQVRGRPAAHADDRVAPGNPAGGELG